MLLRTPWETFSVFIVLLLSLLFFLPDSSFISSLFWRRGFPDSSVDKESTCNAWHPSLIPGSGRSPGEGIGSPLQYSCTSLVAQLGKNLPAMQETWVQSLGWEDPLEKGKATHSSILAWGIQSMVLQRVRHNFHFHPSILNFHWQSYFVFTTLNVPFYCLVAHIVSDEQSSIFVIKF